MKNKEPTKTLKRKRKKNKFKVWRNRISIVLGFLAVLSSAILSVFWILNNFFAVRDIYAKSNIKYDSQDLVDVSGIKKGDSLCFINTASCEMNLCERLPYIDEAKVIKVFPNKVKIEVTLSEPEFSLVFEDKNILISKKDKILEKKDDLTPEIPSIRGLNILKSQAGKVIYEDPSRKDIASKIIYTFRSKNLSKIIEVDVNNVNDIILNYDSRIKILFGGAEDIEYKALTANEIILSKIRSNEKGTLDLRSLKQNKKSYFTPQI